MDLAALRTQQQQLAASVERHPIQRFENSDSSIQPAGVDRRRGRRV